MIPPLSLPKIFTPVKYLTVESLGEEPSSAVGRRRDSTDQWLVWLGIAGSRDNKISSIAERTSRLLFEVWSRS